MALNTRIERLQFDGTIHGQYPEGKAEPHLTLEVQYSSSENYASHPTRAKVTVGMASTEVDRETAIVAIRWLIRHLAIEPEHFVDTTGGR